MYVIRNLVCCALCIWACAQATECSGSSDTCEDSSGLLQSKVSIGDGKPLFDTIDKNEDNHIDRGELQAALDSAEVERPLFGRIDADDNANIDEDEFQKALDSGTISESAPAVSPSTVPPPTLPPDNSPGDPMPAPKEPQRPPRTPKGGVVVGQPYVCGAYMHGTSFHDRKCYCNGDIYYGKKYRSGSSGPQLTFEEMTTIDGGWKDWKASSWQSKGSKMKPMKDLKDSSWHAGWKMSFCGGCKWFKSLNLYGGKNGLPKHCYCMPKYVATTPPPTTTQSFTFAPAPPGDKNRWHFG